MKKLPKKKFESTSYQGEYGRINSELQDLFDQFKAQMKKKNINFDMELHIIRHGEDEPIDKITTAAKIKKEIH